MGSMTIFKHHVPDIEFLGDQLDIFGNNHIPQKDIFIILSLIEIIATSILFAILNVDFCTSVRWLSGNTHKLEHHKWGARSIGRVFGILNTAFNNILYDITLIHKKSTMMFIFQYMVEELPEFKAFLVYKFQNKKTKFVVKSQTKAFTLKKPVEELFSPQYRDNKDSTTMLQTLGMIAFKAMIKQLKDKTKATYKYLSISGTEYSLEHCPETTKKSMLGKMVTNNLSESSFAGVTSQVQTYERVGMCNAAAISDMSGNEYLSRPTNKKVLKEGNRGVFHDFPEQL